MARDLEHICWTCELFQTQLGEVRCKCSWIAKSEFELTRRFVGPCESKMQHKTKCPKACN